MSDRADITIEQNATFHMSVFLMDTATYRDLLAQNVSAADALLQSAVNVTGYSARMRVMRSHDTEEPPIIDIDSTTGGVGDLSGISIDGQNGTFNVVIAKAETAALVPLSAVFDLKVIAPDGAAERLIEGAAIVVKGVTP